MERRQPPQTEEGWYVLHDFRSIDWDAWRDAPERRRSRAIEEGIEYLSAAESVADAEEGDSATFAVLGHKADLLVLHLRPTLADLDALERRFEGTALAEFTERADSYLSVTEVSGYMSQDYFDEDAEVEDTGMARYIETRLKPEIPDSEFLSFYPMDKRRGPEDNWYDLPFDERAEHLSSHGDIGKDYAGRVTQIISGSIGLDDFEWGVTLFGDDPTDVKELLYEMRFDPSSSRFAEFGRFLSARRFPPEDLGAFLAGERIPREGEESHGEHPHAGGESGGHHHGESGGHHEGSGDHHHGDSSSSGRGDHGGSGGPHGDDDEDLRSELEDMGVYAGQPHGEDVHAVVLYSAADAEELFEEVDGLRGNFDHYDTHVKTAVYEPQDGGDDSETAVVSLWETERAASTAAGFLADLPDIVRQAGDDEGDSWGTMGMFYSVKPEHRGDFLGTFEEAGELLAEMDGHRKTDLLINREDENDMFIASRWDSREDAMQFFRSDAFSEAVEFGRDVLTDRPRHVFLA
ncbi:Chlorite dismutase [Haloterrigena turkmenica DSM 5511]|uniref:Chlorite dismutase n=1 Tax=Haloterrigena turkmenica (strain ATCC 51198 / DSM 5511 / JCM 9101 / NCIMB 13204 / VKM B-1734 / 4k) TaxID=543526 RepID=D2RQG0_HALTV|nr:heme-binding protein [Haloterrigena turkmenica]ADB62337.1 Chlorite dismutase [Haloterrigena turkmenica DSM 5511]